jgi:hypothetical protein
LLPDIAAISQCRHVALTIAQAVPVQLCVADQWVKVVGTRQGRPSARPGGKFNPALFAGSRVALNRH